LESLNEAAVAVCIRTRAFALSDFLTKDPDQLDAGFKVKLNPNHSSFDAEFGVKVTEGTDTPDVVNVDLDAMNVAAEVVGHCALIVHPEGGELSNRDS
jgi:hypothetical protein